MAIEQYLVRPMSDPDLRREVAKCMYNYNARSQLEGLPFEQMAVNCTVTLLELAIVSWFGMCGLLDGDITDTAQKMMAELAAATDKMVVGEG